MKQHERGEIATLLTIGTLVVIGVTAIVSSLFTNNKNTIGSRAAVNEYTGCVFESMTICRQDYASEECASSTSCTTTGCVGGFAKCKLKTEPAVPPFSFSCTEGTAKHDSNSKTCTQICGSDTYVSGSQKEDTANSQRYCCCKAPTGTAATCNSTKTFCTNQCGGTTDTSRGYYQGKGDNTGKNYENLDCSGTALDLSKYCCKNTPLCEGASEANMCPDGNNVRNKCIGSTSGQYKCCGPHDNTQYPTANYATWNSEGKCGGATGLENLPPGCCFTDPDCSKYGNGQTCNIPNGSCGGASGKSCNPYPNNAPIKKCVNQQCVWQACSDADKPCVDKCTDTSCQTGDFKCPASDTAHQGKALYNWADGNGTKCVCMNCKVFGDKASNYYCGSDTQNYVDGSLCCQPGQPGEKSSTCAAYGQNTCGLKDKACCTGAGISPCKTADLTCDTTSNMCKPTVSATTCTTSKGGTIPRDGKTHCIAAIDNRTYGLCFDGQAAATEVQCKDGDGTCAAGYGTNGGDGCNKGAYATCNTSVPGKTIANDGKFHCIDSNTFGKCPSVGNVAGNATELDCTNADYPVCSETGYTGGGQAGCVKADTDGSPAPAENCNGTGIKCSTHCANQTDGKIYVEVDNDYWYKSPKYYTKKGGVCTEDTLSNICKCTATPPTGNATYSYNIVLTVDGTAKDGIKNYTLKTAGGTTQAQGALSTNPLTFGGKYGPDVNSTTQCVIEVSGDSLSQASNSFLCSTNASTSVKVTVNGTGNAGDNVTCYSKTCGSICQDFYGMASKTATTDKWFKPGDDVYFYGSGRCDGIDRNNIERNLKSSCQCQTTTWFNIVNNCDKAIDIQRIAFKRGIGIDWYHLAINNPLSPGKSLSRGALDVCQDAAWLEYRTESGTQHDVVFNITNCNGVNQWEISGATNCN